MQSALPKKRILEKKKTKGGHISSHFKSKNKDILTEAQTKDRFNRTGIPESDWHIHVGLSCGKVATAVHQGNGDIFNTWSLRKCVSSWKKKKKQNIVNYFPFFFFFFLRREILFGIREQWEIMLLLLSPIVTSWFTSKEAGPSLSNVFPVLHVAVVWVWRAQTRAHLWGCPVSLGEVGKVCSICRHLQVPRGYRRRLLITYRLLPWRPRNPPCPLTVSWISTDPWAMRGHCTSRHHRLATSVWTAELS